MVILGSATPSLEAEWLGISGAAERLDLPRRIGNLPMPEVRIVDMRHEKPVGPGGLFSPALVRARPRGARRASEQVLLLLNRRGFSTHVVLQAVRVRVAVPGLRGAPDLLPRRDHAPLPLLRAPRAAARRSARTAARRTCATSARAPRRS